MRIKTFVLEAHANGYTPREGEESKPGLDQGYIRMPYCFDSDCVIEVCPNRRAGFGVIILLATGGGEPLQRFIDEHFDDICEKLDEGDTHDRGQLSGRNYLDTDYDGGGRKGRRR